MNGYLPLLLVMWVASAIAALTLPSFPVTFWQAIIGASVTVLIAGINRAQSKRATTLELFKEYYSKDFALDRVKAERFLDRHAGVDWSKDDPYNLPDPDGNRAGYSQVLRYWHRVAVLYDNGALDCGLTERLLSRELGWWFGVVYEQMGSRKTMFTRDLLFELKRRFENGQGRTELLSGLDAGRGRRRTAPRSRWVKGERRWTTKGKNEAGPSGFKK